MHGLGRAGGAVTIVNALPTGVGCALGIGLFAEAEVTLHPAPARGGGELRVARAARSPLVAAAVEGALRRYAPSEGWTVELDLRCEIPPARGLKSSSAVASAIVQAVAHARARLPSALEIGLLSAEVSRAAGVSATGALDDALAGLSGGFVVTDNSLGKVLRADPPDASWSVALLIPPGTHSPSPGWEAAFSAHAREARAGVEAALRGDWWTAMALNTELVERTMRYSYGSLRRVLLRDGALGAGVSGLGPALAAVAPTDRVRQLVAALPVDAGERRAVPVLAQTPDPPVRPA